MSSLFTLLKTTFNNFITEPAREPVRMRFTQVYVFLVQDYSFSRFISSLGRRSSAREVTLLEWLGGERKIKYEKSVYNMKEKQEVVKQSVNIGSTLGNSTAMASGNTSNAPKTTFFISNLSRDRIGQRPKENLWKIFFSFFHSPEELTWNWTQSLPALIYRVDSPNKSCWEWSHLSSRRCCGTTISEIILTNKIYLCFNLILNLCSFSHAKK